MTKEEKCFGEDLVVMSNGTYEMSMQRSAEILLDRERFGRR